MSMEKKRKVHYNPNRIAFAASAFNPEEKDLDLWKVCKQKENDKQCN